MGRRVQGPPVAPLRHFYHVWADGEWAEPVAEHAAAVRDSGLDADITVGIVGQPGNRHAVREALAAELPGRRLSWTLATAGFEEVTLDRLWRWAQGAPGATPVLYAHSKGAWHPSAFNTWFRRDLTAALVAGWRDCVPLLGGHDLVGCHWLRPEDFVGDVLGTPFYSGNFWWARAGWLAALPRPPRQQGRFVAERWIGTGPPARAYDWRPGWWFRRHYGTGMSAVRMFRGTEGEYHDGARWRPYPGPGQVGLFTHEHAAALILAGRGEYVEQGS